MSGLPAHKALRACERCRLLFENANGAGCPVCGRVPRSAEEAGGDQAERLERSRTVEVPLIRGPAGDKLS